MLTNMRAWLAFHVQAAITSLNSLCRKPLATTMTILVIGITLALPALFWVFTDNMEQLTTSWQRSGHISLYLKPSLMASEENILLKRVQETVGVGFATLK